MKGASVKGDAPRPPALTLAAGAAVVGGLYAAISAYWGGGGTALLDTVGGSLAQGGGAQRAGLLAVVWATVVLKLIACGLGLRAVAPPRWLSERRHRLVRAAAWLAATVLVLYGALLTSVGLLVQAGVVPASAHADHRALRWHAYLWDPWFLLWGLVLAAALAVGRPAAGDAAGTG